MADVLFPILIGSIAVVMLAAERLFPFASPKPSGGSRLSRMGRNLALAGINVAAAQLVVLSLAALAPRFQVNLRPAWLTQSLGLALDLLVLDLWTYCWHRVVHAWPFAWRFHQVHHLDEVVDATTAVRFHAGDVLLGYSTRACVILVLGIPLPHALMFELVTVGAAIFHHSNVRLAGPIDRLLSLLIVTPRLHRIHHDRRREVHDSTYGTIFSVWDRVFGTRVAPDGARSTGLAERCDEPFLRLITLPLRDPRFR